MAPTSSEIRPAELRISPTRLSMSRPIDSQRMASGAAGPVHRHDAVQPGFVEPGRGQGGRQLPRVLHAGVLEAGAQGVFQVARLQGREARGGASSLDRLVQQVEQPRQLVLAELGAPA